MRTACLETVHASVSVATTRYHWGGVGPQMNKFEQVSNGVVGPKSDVRGLYSEAQCIMGNCHIGTPNGDTHLWKHYFPSTSLTSGKKQLFENPDCN